jgi:hypothetical protein
MSIESVARMHQPMCAAPRHGPVSPDLESDAPAIQDSWHLLTDRLCAYRCLVRGDLRIRIYKWQMSVYTQTSKGNVQLISYFLVCQTSKNFTSPLILSRVWRGRGLVDPRLPLLTKPDRHCLTTIFSRNRA